MAKELELKFYADDAVHAAVLTAFAGKAETIEMATTYYDTPSRSFSGRKMTLRARLENGVSVCTLKTPLPGNARGEWEAVAQTIEDAVPLLVQKGAPEDLKVLAAEGLAPICGARFTRRAIRLEEKEFSAEIALDKGILTGGGKEIPLCELEVEYKSGDEGAFLAYCKAFATLYRLTECKESKFRRAYRLCAGECIC